MDNTYEYLVDVVMLLLLCYYKTTTVYCCCTLYTCTGAPVLCNSSVQRQPQTEYEKPGNYSFQGCTYVTAIQSCDVPAITDYIYARHDRYLNDRKAFKGRGCILIIRVQGKSSVLHRTPTSLCCVTCAKKLDHVCLHTW